MKQAVIFIVLVMVLFLPAEGLTVPDHIEYNINVDKDGSASWTVVRATDINSTAYSCDELEQKLLSTINAAKDRTGRGMALDVTSLQMKTEVHWEASSQTIEYVFRWENFSIVKEGQINFGDVFGDDFFSTFCGDGELSVTYPEEYSIDLASVLAGAQTSSPQTLRWYRTQYFLSGKPNIVLTKQDRVTNQGPPVATIAVLFSATLVAVTVGFLLFNNRRNRNGRLSQQVEPSQWQGVEGNKEKILQLVRSSGGSMKQSEICTRLKFSRAKTSILLAEMEKNNQVRRDKNGKNKMVYITK